MNDELEMSENDMVSDIGAGDDSIRDIIEALMIATTEPLPLRSIAEIVNVPEATVRTYIEQLNEEYHSTGRAFEIKEIAGGFQIYTLPKFAEWVGALHKRKERLSKAALETLAIVAYHQPIIRAQIEKIRGVDSTSVLDTLMQKNLIKTCGRLPSPGRPIKYGTTKEFLRYFGIKDISELPNEEDFGERVMSGYPDVPKAAVEKTGSENDLSMPEPQNFEGDSEVQGENTDAGGDGENDFPSFDDDLDKERGSAIESDDEVESPDESVDAFEDSGQTDQVEDSEEVYEDPR
jgi:segregation and condensation protein B